MDGRGRLAETLAGAFARLAAGAAPDWRSMRARQRLAAWRSRVERLGRRWSGTVQHWHVPRGAGIAAAALLLSASIGYGTVLGGHAAAVGAQLSDARDAVANGFGFRITSIALAGGRQLTREESLPQTIYRVKTIAGQPVVAFIRLQVGK